MTAEKIFNQCLIRLDFTPEASGEELYKGLLSKAVHIINDIYLDLAKITGEGDICPINSLSDHINLKPSCHIALIYGACMGLALKANQLDDYNFYSALYNSQRLKFSTIYKRKEVV